MVKANVVDLRGSVLKNIDLDDRVFGIQPNAAVVHQAVVAQERRIRGTKSPAPGVAAGETTTDEGRPVKKATFAELGRVTRPDCVLASNSSTLDIDAFARASGRPAQVLGHHFFSPANVMKLVEIVRGRDTARETIATSLKLAKRLGKVGVVVGNCFGFVANRMLAYYMREAYLLLEEGASVPQIDKALTDFGMPVGPFGMQDIAGIDVGARIRQYLKSIGAKTRAEGPQSEIPDQLFAMGRYGQKTGAGWYKYAAPGSRDRMPDPLIEKLEKEIARLRKKVLHSSQLVPAEEGKK